MRISNLRYINPEEGIPPLDMTNKIWQEYYKFLRQIIHPSVFRNMRGGASSFTINGTKVYDDAYYGETLFATRRNFINDVLKQIRSGHTDYVYHIYNISELLKYEHEKLQTFYDQKEQCFIVWLLK